MKKACGSFLPTRKFTLKKKLTLLRINLKNLYFRIIITKLICSLGYNKYVAKLSDMVPPALDYSLHLLGIDFISRRRRSLSAWISLHTLTISRFSWVMFSHFSKRLDHTKQCPKFWDVWPIENVIVKERVAKKKCENISWSARLSKCGGKSMLTRTFFVGWWVPSPRGAGL